MWKFHFTDGYQNFCFLSHFFLLCTKGIRWPNKTPPKVQCVPTFYIYVFTLYKEFVIVQNNLTLNFDLKRSNLLKQFNSYLTEQTSY